MTDIAPNFNEASGIESVWKDLVSWIAADADSALRSTNIGFVHDPLIYSLTSDDTISGEDREDMRRHEYLIKYSWQGEWIRLAITFDKAAGASLRSVDFQSIKIVNKGNYVDEPG